MSYDVRQFSAKADKQGLMALWAECLNHPETANRRYTALYESNPGQKVHTWLLEDSKSTMPVGCMSLFEREVPWQGGVARVGIHFDVMVTKRHRTLGPAMQLLNGLLNDVKNLELQALIGMPNELSVSLIKRAGYDFFGNLDRFCHLFKTGQFIINALLNVYSMHLLKKGLYFQTFKDAFEQPVSLNVFEQEHIPYACHGFKASRPYMEWRYRDMGAPGTTLFFLSLKDRPLGYAIYRIEERKGFIDNIGVFGQDRDLTPLLLRFIDKIRQDGVDSLSASYLSNGPLAHLFRSLGFFRRESRGVYLKLIDPSLIPLFEDPSVWSFFDSDLDM